MWRADTINIKLEDGYTLKGYETIKTILEGATSYFANIKNLPNNFIPIAICGKAPDNYLIWDVSDDFCHRHLVAIMVFKRRNLERIDNPLFFRY